jgi:hypothetical protein
MAKVKDNIVTEGTSGKLGKHLVFRYMKDGRTIIATRPDYSNHEWTADQRTHHNRFQQAAAYARLASKTNPLYTELTRGTAKNAYNLALSDWFHAPVIQRVTRQDGRICVDVTDNVQVTKVLITILDEQRQTQGQGQAVLVKDARWEYQTLTEGSIIVEAFDPAGNVTRQEAYPNAKQIMQQ